MKHQPWLPLARDYTLISIGVVLQALSMVLFYIPGNLAAGGLSGIAQLIGNFTGWPVGTLYIVLNVPLLALGGRHLGGRRFLTRTIFAVLGYSIAMDLLTVVLPKNGLTTDSILNALYGGVIGGIGVGLVLRGQGTTGGTDILVRLLNFWRGIPYSQTYIAPMCSSSWSRAYRSAGRWRCTPSWRCTWAASPPSSPPKGCAPRARS